MGVGGVEGGGIELQPWSPDRAKKSRSSGQADSFCEETAPATAPRSPTDVRGHLPLIVMVSAADKRKNTHPK